jgi:hypothetical protein
MYPNGGSTLTLNPLPQSSTSWNASLAGPERTIEDRLREEYFDLLPDIRRVLNELEAEVKHSLVSISLRLDKYERLVVTSRVKECESALDSLPRRQEGATFDSEQPELYSLRRLNDLVGVRVLAFPPQQFGGSRAEVARTFPTVEGRPSP